jgi:hypothetical protein
MTQCRYGKIADYLHSHCINCYSLDLTLEHERVVVLEVIPLFGPKRSVDISIGGPNEFTR